MQRAAIRIKKIRGVFYTCVSIRIKNIRGVFYTCVSIRIKNIRVRSIPV